LTAVLIGATVAMRAAATSRWSSANHPAAVDAASPGDRITVQPGIYREPDDTVRRYHQGLRGRRLEDDVSLIADARPGRP